MSPPRIALQKEGQVVYDVPLRDLAEIDCLSDPSFDYYPFGLVRLKHGTPQGHWFVVKIEDMARCFPRRWRPA